MAEANVDMLMMIRDGTTGIAAEGLSTVDTTDDLTSDFTAGTFFELQDWEMGIDLEDSDSSAKAKAATQHGTGNTTSGKGTTEEKTPPGGKFAKWTQGLAVSAQQGSLANMFPIQMEPFGFTRQMDKASPQLFQRCFLTKPFDSAVLVMRKAGGLQKGSTTTIGSVPFLRLDFSPVLIISIDWDGDEVVKEKCKFVCREVKVQYRPQNHDGTPGKIVKNTQPLTLVKTT